MTDTVRYKRLFRFHIKACTFIKVVDFLIFPTSHEHHLVATGVPCHREDRFQEESAVAISSLRLFCNDVLYHTIGSSIPSQVRNQN